MNPDGELRRGVLYGLAAYGLWGLFPLYFHLLRSSSPLEVVLHRVVWALLVCVLALAVARSWTTLRPLLTPRTAGLLALAATVLSLNWGVYIHAVVSGQVVQASLGYYINPLVTVLIGVLALRERLRRAQWAALAVGAVAVVVLTVEAGRPPVIALTLACSFAIYSLVKNLVGPSIGALASMTGETLVLAPFALLALGWLHAGGQGTFTTDGPWHTALLVGAGPATVLPLVLFAASARRVPLSTVGLMQYLTPTLQLLCGVALLGERMSPARWAGFGLVWLALVILSADTLGAARRRSRAVAAQPEAVPA